jgi:hypothetical protein
MWFAHKWHIYLVILGKHSSYGNDENVSVYDWRNRSNPKKKTKKQINKY